MELGASRSWVRKWPRARQQVYVCLSWPIPCVTWHCAVAPRRLRHTYGSGSTAITFRFGRRNSALRVARCQPQFGAQVAKGGCRFIMCLARPRSRRAYPRRAGMACTTDNFGWQDDFQNLILFLHLCPERSLNRTCTAGTTALTARGLHNRDDRKVVFQICEN